MLRFFALGSVGALAVSAPADAPLLEQLRKTRSIFPSLQADYQEVIDVTEQSSPEPGASGVGFQDSKRLLKCTIDSTSFGCTPFESGSTAAASSSYYQSGKYFSTSSAGTKGAYGKRSGPEIAPIASGFCIFSEDFLEVCRTRRVESASPNSLHLVYSEDGEFEVSFATGERGTYISKIVGGSKSRSNKQVLETTEWMSFGKVQIPKQVRLTFEEGGAVTQIRKYSLVTQTVKEITPLAWKWKEGAIIQDNDTQAVYIAKNGELVPDPVFMKPAALKISLQRARLPLGLVLIGIWTAWRLRLKSTNKTVKAS